MSEHCQRVDRKDLKLDKEQLSWILSAFFWTYAFAQLPAGWLGDRFGARWVLSSYVILWSLCTAMLAWLVASFRCSFYDWHAAV